MLLLLAPSPAFSEMAKEIKEESYTEIRLEKKINEAKDVAVEIGNVAKPF